jgi:hypothetical protein
LQSPLIVSIGLVVSAIFLLIASAQIVDGPAGESLEFLRW